MREKKPKISIITPVFNEELGLDRYYETVSNVLLNSSSWDFEIIFVDDGSDDDSWKKIQQICRSDLRCRAVRLSRNFGSHVALSAGIQVATGDAVATLACDLQDPAEVILEFIEKWTQGAKIVWGKRRHRDDIFWKIWTSKFFFILLKKYAMPKKSKFATGSFFLIDRSVVNYYKNFQEHNRIAFALVAWTGFAQDVVIYDRKARQTGISGWNFSLMLKTLCDAFVAFSNLPARLVIGFGVFIWFMTLIFGVYLVANYFLSNVVPGWTAVMLMISFFFGSVSLILGLVMEYLRRIYIEVTNRPLYFISDNINLEI